MRKKTHDLLMKQQAETYEAKFDEARELEYDRARKDFRRELREFLVDANYNLYQTDNSMLRGHVQALITQSLATFYDKPVKGKVPPR